MDAEFLKSLLSGYAEVTAIGVREGVTIGQRAGLAAGQKRLDEALNAVQRLLATRGAGPKSEEEILARRHAIAMLKAYNIPEADTYDPN